MKKLVVFFFIPNGKSKNTQLVPEINQHTTGLQFQFLSILVPGLFADPSQAMIGLV